MANRLTDGGSVMYFPATNYGSSRGPVSLGHAVITREPSWFLEVQHDMAIPEVP